MQQRYLCEVTTWGGRKVSQGRLPGGGEGGAGTELGEKGGDSISEVGKTW